MSVIGEFFRKKTTTEDVSKSSGSAESVDSVKAEIFRWTYAKYGIAGIILLFVGFFITNKFTSSDIEGFFQMMKQFSEKQSSVLVVLIICITIILIMLIYMHYQDKDRQRKHTEEMERIKQKQNHRVLASATPETNC